MNKTIHLTALISDESAVVEVTAPTASEQGEGSLRVTGWSKKHPNDLPDRDIGFNLAAARALRALADEYEKRAAPDVALQPYVYHFGFPSTPTFTFTEGKI